MNNLSMIAAIGKNNELGYENKLLWHLKEDMQFFRKTTTGKTIIMGRKTFESLPGLLPKRKHIIITNNQNYQNNDVIIMHSVDEVINYIQNTQEECFIIGGGKVYKEFLPFAHTLYLTEIEDSKRADTFFPVFSKDDYQKEILGSSSENNINYSFAKYTKKSN